MKKFENLMSFNKDTLALNKIADRLSWDQATMMPKGAVIDRIEEFAAIEKVIHSRQSSNELSDLLDDIQQDKLNRHQKRQFYLISRAFARTRKVPQELAVALARLKPKSKAVWVQARYDDDFSSFKPLLSQMIAMRQEEGRALAKEKVFSPYDALLTTMSQAALPVTFNICLMP